MHKRINVTLPEETITLLEEHAPKGDRSRLIDLAVRRYLDEEYRTKLRQELAPGYRQNRKLNRELAEDWRPLEEESWPGRKR